MWNEDGSINACTEFPREKAQVVFVFGAGQLLAAEGGVTGAVVADLERRYPNAVIAGCSTAGDIHGTSITDADISVTAVHFEKTQVVARAEPIPGPDACLETGSRLARALPKEGLQHVFALCKGLNVNGSDLIKGMTDELPANVGVSGGLAGDGTRFGTTWILSDGESFSEHVMALGFYGNSLRVGCSATGPWDEFGPERRVTSSSKNEVFEFNGQSALALYKSYLGELAADLPASGLFSPIALRNPNSSHCVIRTLLACDEAKQEA